MDLFDKIYGRYYHIVDKILRAAGKRPLSRKEMERITENSGFQESALTIVPNLIRGVWPLMKAEADGSYRAILSPTLPLPLTELQKSWLISLLHDRRLRLFLSEGEADRLEDALSGGTSLYDEADFHYFDRYRDGDPYDSTVYRQHFQDILTAFSENRALRIAYMGRSDTVRNYELRPCHLQYSSKDDKFRLCGLEHYRGGFNRRIILNLGKIVDCHILDTHFENTDAFFHRSPQKTVEPVVLEISGERNSLERCMLHFSNYEKHTEYDENKKCFVCSIQYNKADETELLIDVLSFGPVVRVIGPDAFLEQIKERVRLQHERFCEPRDSDTGL